MAKELYIYSPLYDFTAETVVKQLNEVAESEELTVRLNSPGGNVTAGWAIISKLSERKSPTNVIIDGDAASMAALMLVFFDNVIANDTSNIMFHKAAYPNYYKPSTEEIKSLKNINNKFREKLEAKVNGKQGAQEFIDKVFETDVRNNVELTPEKALKLNIVNEIRKLEVKAEYGMQLVAIKEIKAESKPPESGEINSNLNNKSMDLAELEAKYPAVYNQAVAVGVTQGIAQNQDRVGAYLAFMAIDAKAVAEGIKSGNAITETFKAEMSVKQMSQTKVVAMEKENPEATKTKTEVKTEEQIKAEETKAEMDKLFNEEA